MSDVMDPMTSDITILEYARVNDMVFVTQDLDFSSLLALGGYLKPSLVNLRLNEPTPAAVKKRPVQVLPKIEKELMGGAVATIDETTVRIKKLPIDFG